MASRKEISRELKMYEKKMGHFMIPATAMAAIKMRVSTSLKEENALNTSKSRYTGGTNSQANTSMGGVVGAPSPLPRYRDIVQ